MQKEGLNTVIFVILFNYSPKFWTYRNIKVSSAPCTSVCLYLCMSHFYHHQPKALDRGLRSDLRVQFLKFRV